MVGFAENLVFIPTIYVLLLAALPLFAVIAYLVSGKCQKLRQRTILNIIVVTTGLIAFAFVTSALVHEFWYPEEVAERWWERFRFHIVIGFILILAGHIYAFKVAITAARKARAGCHARREA